MGNLLSVRSCHITLLSSVSNRTVLLNNEVTIDALLERCQLEFSDEMVVKVSILLQLPLRRVSEYHELIERVQLRLEVSQYYVCL